MASLTPRVDGDVAVSVPAHIAREAARLFAARGYDATSVREIAEAAGVTKPTLYYHFQSKEGLARNLLLQPLLELAADLRAMLDNDSEPIRLAAGFVERMFAFCCDDPDRSRFAHAQFFGPPGSPLVAEICRHADQIDHLWCELGRRLAAAGIVDSSRVEAFVLNLRGVSTLHVLLHLYRDAALDPGLSTRIVEDLLRGFAPDSLGA